jgi:sugar/nucleoside kinase (ribokinase family)
MAALRLAKEAGMSTSLDAASAAPIRADPAAIADALGHVDLLLANEDELDALGPRGAIEDLILVVKRGPDGAELVRPGSRVAAASMPTEVVDTTGAGDAFAAGFLKAWMAGAGDAESLAAGNAVAAIAVARVGGGPPSP